MIKLTDAQVIEMRAKYGWAKETIRAIEAEVLRINGWQPIETAPRDGTSVLIYMPEASRKKVMEAYWGTRWEGAPKDQCWWTTPHGPAGRGYTILPKAVTHWMPLPAAPGDHIGDANKMVERRQLIEIEQRARLRERFKDRVPSPATADFDLPVACSDDATPRATGCPDTMDDTGHFAEVDMPAFLKKQAS